MADAKHPLSAQVAEVRREIGKRREVYARQVTAGKMRQGEADYKISVMESVAKTLDWMIENEPELRAYIANKVAVAAEKVLP